MRLAAQSIPTQLGPFNVSNQLTLFDFQPDTTDYN